MTDINEIKRDEDLIKHMDALLEAFDNLPTEIKQLEFRQLELSKITIQKIIDAVKLGTSEELQQQAEKSLLLAEILKLLNVYCEMAIMSGFAERKKDIDK